MITAAEKQELIDWVKNLEDHTLLQLLKDLKESEVKEKDIYLVSEPEREAIDKALKSYEEGKSIPHEKVMEEMKKKFPHLF